MKNSFMQVKKKGKMISADKRVYLRDHVKMFEASVISMPVFIP